jgi:hypothetical protein
MKLIKKYKPKGGKTKRYSSFPTPKTYKVVVELDQTEFYELIGDTEEGRMVNDGINLPLMVNDTLTKQFNERVQSFELDGCYSGEDVFGKKPLKVYQYSHSFDYKGEEISFDIDESVFGLNDKEVVQ